MNTEILHETHLLARSGERLVGLLSAPAAAQTYPSRTVSVVVPYPAGGSVDGVARIIAQKLNETLGQHFIVENRAGGAGGAVGANYVAKAAPDGYDAAADRFDPRHHAVPEQEHSLRRGEGLYAGHADRDRPAARQHDAEACRPTT